jgi:pseudoazurin
MKKNLSVLSLVAGAALVMASAAHATEHQVKLANAGAQGMMVFEPGFMKVKPGDSIRFIPADQGHTVDSIDGMAPAGVASVHGAMGKELVFKFTKPGLYGFKCNPHMGFGMAMIVQAGNASNLAQVQAAVVKQPPLMRKRLNLDLAQVK